MVFLRCTNILGIVALLSSTLPAIAERSAEYGLYVQRERGFSKIKEASQAYIEALGKAVDSKTRLLDVLQIGRLALAVTMIEKVSGKKELAGTDEEQIALFEDCIKATDKIQLDKKATQLEKQTFYSVRLACLGAKIKTMPDGSDKNKQGMKLVSFLKTIETDMLKEEGGVEGGVIFRTLAGIRANIAAKTIVPGYTIYDINKASQFIQTALNTSVDLDLRVTEETKDKPKLRGIDFIENHYYSLLIRAEQVIDKKTAEDILSIAKEIQDKIDYYHSLKGAALTNPSGSAKGLLPEFRSLENSYYLIKLQNLHDLLISNSSLDELGTKINLLELE